MNRLFLIVSSLIALTFHLHADEDYELAKQAAEIFPDEDVVLTNSKLIIDIQKDWTSKGVVAIKRYREDFINLNKNVKFTYPIFYGEESEITMFDCGYSGSVNDSYHQDKSIFHDDSRVKWGYYKVYKHAYKSILQADKKYEDMRYLTSAYFTNYFGCMNREIQFIIPNGVELDLVPFNFEGYDIKKTEEIKKKETIITYTVKNIKKFSDEEGVPGPSHVYPHILIRVKSYVYKDKKVELFKDLNALYGWYRKMTRLVDNKPDVLQSTVDELTKGKTTDKEKLESIFYWVQDNIRYIAIEDGIAGYKPENCQNVFNYKYGDCKGMANLTKHMLKLAGYDARLAWVGTKRIAYDYSTPSLACDNHMICAVKLNDTYEFLDATEKYINYGEYAERIQGRQVLIENGDLYVKETIPIKKPSQNLRKINLELQLNKEDVLVGNLSMELNGEQRSNLFQYMSGINASKHEEILKNITSALDKNILAENVSKLEMQHGEKNTTLTASLNIKNYVSEFENEKYIYINPFKYYADLNFKERELDYCFSEKKKDLVSISFVLPDNLSLKSLPNAFTIDDEEFSIAFSCAQEGNKITYSLDITFFKAQISKNNFEDWNKARKKLADLYDYPLIFSI